MMDSRNVHLCHYFYSMNVLNVLFVLILYCSPSGFPSRLWPVVYRYSYRKR